MALPYSFPTATTTTTTVSDSEEAICSAAERGQWTLRAERTTGSSQIPPLMPPAAADRSAPSLTEVARSRWLPAVAVHAPRVGPSLASSLAR